ncbi:MAG: MFS transporter [Sphaerochaetaceae bacterium]|nr:MFS transporter [Sphaerochaetaceae bacterium]
MTTPEQTHHWKRKTILFLISQCVTLFGSTLVQMAIVWYVTLGTSSGAWVAAFSVCSYLPQFFASFVGGVWADRYDRKALIIGADLTIAAVTLVMMLAIPRIADESVLLGGLLVMSVLRSVGAGIQTPAVNAVIPQLVPESQLMRFNGINATMQSLVQFAAPAAAGAVLTVGTLRFTLSMDVATALLGTGVFCFVKLPRQEEACERTSLGADMGMGLHYAFSDKMIGKLLAVYGLFTFLCVPAGFLAGLFVSRVYGTAYWYLTAVELAGFLGMMAGGLLISAWGGRTRHVTTLLVGLTVFGAMAIGMGLSANFIVYLVLMMMYGIALTTVQTAMTTLVQQKTAPAMQGRVLGLLGSLYAGCMPAGMAVFGPMADVVPLRWMMIGSGVSLMLLAMFLRFDRHFSGDGNSFLKR